MFCVVFKQWVSPCRPLKGIFIYRIWWCSSRTTPDWWTTCCITDVHMLTKELSNKSCIRCFCTTCTASWELKKWLIILWADCRYIRKCRLKFLFANVCNKIIKYRLLVCLWFLRNHLKSTLSSCRTYSYTFATTHTVKRWNGHCKLHCSICRMLRISKLDIWRSLCNFICI